jgi:DNA primase small subunit
VFDIDMTDYDDIRTCCEGANICLKCWDFMTISIQILHRALVDDFGFKNILWVYSGRRGVHCWVCDPIARSLTGEARRGIVNYLELVKGGKQAGKKVNLFNNLHPSLSEAYKVCHSYFSRTLLDQMGILDTPQHWMKVLDLIPDKQIKDKLNSDWSNPKKALNSIEKWDQILLEIKRSNVFLV